MFQGIICVVLIVAVLTEVSAWTYSDQGAWDENCSGEMQSPINIISRDAKKRNLESFNFTSYDTKSDRVTLVNIMSTANLLLGDPAPLLSGGGLASTYEFLFLQFHWGSPSDNKGSEHLVDGHQYALELQLYHWNTAYGNVATASDKPDGFAVLSILYDVGPANNALEPLVAKLPNILEGESEHFISDSSIPALSSFLPSDTSKFYRYYGSMTAPFCYESVIWTVFANRLTVSIAQLTEFRKLRDITTDSPIVSNFRVVQNSAIKVIYSETNKKTEVCGLFLWIKSGSWCSYI